MFKEFYVRNYRAGASNCPAYFPLNKKSCCIMPILKQIGYCHPVTIITTIPPPTHFLQIKQHIILQPIQQTTKFISTGNHIQAHIQTYTPLNQYATLSQACMNRASKRRTFKAIGKPPVSVHISAPKQKMVLPSINIKPAMVPLKIKTTQRKGHRPMTIYDLTLKLAPQHDIKTSTTKHYLTSFQPDVNPRLFRSKQTRIYIRKYAYQIYQQKVKDLSKQTRIYIRKYAYNDLLDLQTSKHSRNRSKHKACAYWATKKSLSSNQLNLIKIGAQDSRGLDSSIH